MNFFEAFVDCIVDLIVGTIDALVNIF